MENPRIARILLFCDGQDVKGRTKLVELDVTRRAERRGGQATDSRRSKISVDGNTR
jgi:hypothetical protein